MGIILSIVASVIGPSTITITNNARYPVCEVVYESRYYGTFTAPFTGAEWTRTTKRIRVEAGQAKAFIPTDPSPHVNEVRLVSYAGC